MQLESASASESFPGENMARDQGLDSPLGKLYDSPGYIIFKIIARYSVWFRACQAIR
jgi:hypothetical protein